MLKVTLVGDKELLLKLERMPGRVMANLRQTATILALKLEAYVKTGKLAGQVLNKRTGRLARSIANDVSATDTSVQGKVFSSGDVKYAAIHEFGGKTKAHEILPQKANALRFMAAGKVVFAKKVNHPGSQMPERSFLRSALKDKTPEIESGLKAAVLKGLEK